MSTKTTVKTLVKTLFLVLVLPLYLLLELFSLAGNRDGCFQSFSQALSLIPGKTGSYLRAAFYRLACPDTSDDICIGFLTVLSHRDTSIHPGVYIGPQCNIGKCTIGKNTLLGSGVHILSGNKQHDFSDTSRPIKEQGGSFEKISVGGDCWLGNGALVMASLPDHTIVAAGSVMTQSAPESWLIYAGNPARARKSRKPAENVTEDC